MILGNKKAISPLFASLLILGVVTVLFVPVFIWSTGMTAETRSFWEILGLVTTERIVIEEVNLRGGENSSTIYIRNIGETATIIDNIFISSPDNQLYIYEKGDFTSDKNSIVKGDLLTLTIPDLTVQGSFTPTSELTYTIKVFTERGVGDNYQIVA
jgi:lipopolysaccharide export LptBFGC system permease protein LptF